MVEKIWMDELIDDRLRPFRPGPTADECSSQLVVLPCQMSVL